MSNIFKKNISKNLLIDFLDKICRKENNYYIIDKYCYKKSLINNEIYNFYNSIEEYYHKSKTFYIKRDKTYNNFITIIRQICKLIGILFKKNIKFFNSNYEIIYYIKDNQNN